MKLLELPHFNQPGFFVLLGLCLLLLFQLLLG